MNKLYLLLKYFILFMIGGTTYYCIELLYKGGHSHWTMFGVGGLCFVLIGGINEFIPWEMKLCKQMLIGSCIVTVVEFLSGLIINVWLGLNVWSYENLPLNILGQVCLPFSIIWFFLSLLAIIVDDYLRYWWFKEEKPHYDLL